MAKWGQIGPDWDVCGASGQPLAAGWQGAKTTRRRSRPRIAAFRRCWSWSWHHALRAPILREAGRTQVSERSKADFALESPPVFRRLQRPVPSRVLQGFGQRFLGRFPVADSAH